MDPNFNIDNDRPWKDAYGNAWHSNSSFHQNTLDDQFDTDRAINGWKYHLTKDDIIMTETICGSLMTHFGYEFFFDRFDSNLIQNFNQYKKFLLKL